MNYLDYINQPILKAFFGNKMPTLGPNATEKDVKKFQDWAVDNGYMQQSDLVGKGYGSYGPLTTKAYRQAVADQKNKKSTSPITSRPKTQSVEPGVYYVNYPDYDVTVNESTGNTAKLGHAGVLTVDENGQQHYYEYGRYNTGIGYDKKGNWRERDIPTEYGTDMDSISEYLLSINPKANGTTRLTRVPDADVAATQQYIMDDANNPNRKSYSWGRFWDPKTCGSEASAAIQAGYKEGVPVLERAVRNINGIVQEQNPVRMMLNGIGQLFGQGIRLGPGAIDATPQEFEDNWRNKGYKTYKYNGNN